MNTESLCKAAEILKQSKHTIAFTGAGISVESGIPPFRGSEGLWSKYDPEVLDINYFYCYPKQSWEVIKEIFYDFFSNAQPNQAHKALARMEKEGKLHAVITQNIDNLHQAAGSKTVYEFHGNSQKIICTGCAQKFDAKNIDLKWLPPQCTECGNLLKPDFVFFGEAIPEFAHTQSVHEASHCSVILVIGTTGEVMPAGMIPYYARQNGATVIEINPEESNFTKQVTDIFLCGKAGEIMEKLSEMIFL